MKNFNFEPIIVLIIFILIPLANYVLARMRRRFEPPSSTRQPMPDMGMRRQAAPESVSQSAAYTERATPPPPTRTMSPSSRRWSRQTLFRTRHDVRRTIVAMTILSPCRAYDPPG
jgi:hypothetical protein